jgi:hypothetical protein
MFGLRVVQAEFGDCLILEAGGGSARKFVLVDGGPDLIYERHLRAELKAITAAGGSLELVILSHVDEDHVLGLLAFLAELRNQAANGDAPTIAVKAVWHNSFAKTIGSGNDIQTRLANVLGAGGVSMQAAGMAVRGIGEGNQLRIAALALGLPLNPGFPDDLILVDTAPPTVKFGDLSLRVVGPTQANLDELKSDWIDWLDKHEDEIGSGDPFVMANADQSVPNLSSIMLLAEADGKRMLLTGDGRSDHLLQGLEKAGLLDAEGKMHVQVLKLPHHGSDRNITKTFLRKVTADTYVASANGKDKNPDLATLIWIVETAQEQGRKILIVSTNRTPSIEKLLEEYPRNEFDYEVKVLKKTDHSLLVEPVTH